MMYVASGAGVGLCGLFMSKVLGCRSTLITDLSEAIELLNKNIQHNIPSHPVGCGEEVTGNESGVCPVVAAQVLSWGNMEDQESALRAVGWPPHGCDNEDDELLIVAADCVYWECLYDAFFRTLQFFTSQGRRVRVLYAHVKRWKKENKFFRLCQKHLDVEVIFEKVEMVPDPISGQDNDGDEFTDDGNSQVNSNDHIRMRRQITRVYSMRAKK
jgi:hypothetical protein